METIESDIEVLGLYVKPDGTKVWSPAKLIRERGKGIYEIIDFNWGGKVFDSTVISGLEIRPAQHRVHADEKPATVKTALSARNILSRLLGWFSAFRR